MVRAMLRLTPAFGLVVGAGLLGPVPAALAGVGAATVPVRTVCDADGRCYETGDPGYRDDDRPPPRRYAPDDDDRPPPPPRRHRYDPDDDDRPPPPRRHFDPDDPDRPPPPRSFDPDDN